MQVLMNGIYNQFLSSTGAGSLYVLLSGKLYPYEAPQGITYPYGVYFVPSMVPEYVFDTTTNLENALIQFNLYDDDNSPTDTNTNYTALTTLYDWCDLAVTGYTNVKMQREFSNLARGERLWDYMIQYRVIIQKD